MALSSLRHGEGGSYDEGRERQCLPGEWKEGEGEREGETGTGRCRQCSGRKERLREGTVSRAYVRRWGRIETARARKKRREEQRQGV